MSMQPFASEHWNMSLESAFQLYTARIGKSQGSFFLTTCQTTCLDCFGCHMTGAYQNLKLIYLSNLIKLNYYKSYC